MKTVFVKKEGVKMNPKLDFGSCESILDEFQYLMSTLEYMWDIDIEYFYRVTDDNYIQLAIKVGGGELEIKAQYKLRHDSLKENIIFILKQNIEANLPYEGFPSFKNSVLFSKEEFDDIIQAINDEKNAIREQAYSQEAPIIVYLREQHLNPKPTDNNPNSWIANCPSGRNHHIMIVTKNDEWGCGYCCRKGKLPELKDWLLEIEFNNDQKMLSKMLKEFKVNTSLKSEEIIKWWMNRY